MEPIQGAVSISGYIIEQGLEAPFLPSRSHVCSLPKIFRLFSLVPFLLLIAPRDYKLFYLSNQPVRVPSFSAREHICSEPSEYRCGWDCLLGGPTEWLMWKCLEERAAAFLQLERLRNAWSACHPWWILPPHPLPQGGQDRGRPAGRVHGRVNSKQTRSKYYQALHQLCSHHGISQLKQSLVVMLTCGR